MNKSFSAFGFLLLVIAGLFHVTVHAGTYASAVTTFNWIDPSTHTRVGATTTPYKFNSGFGCATSLPTVDDNISDKIPMGFNFLFGDKVFDSVRIQSNGRIHLINNAIPWDNTTCGAGSPVTQLPIPNAGLNYVMRLYGNDLDPTPKRSGYTTVCADGVTAANNPCYVSFATVGTAPNRRFVVSWKGVPEWVSSGAKGAYDIQIIIQEDGDFVYQYGPYVAGPAATAGQVGYQLSTSNFDVPTTGFPAQNFAIRFFVPHPLVEYLMEQSNWSGANSVIDSSGSNQHGSPIGGVNTVSMAKVCLGADIPSNANTNNIDAIDSGVNVSTDIGSAGTIAFWYKAKSAWSGASIKDAQLLDATIVNNQWFFVVRQSNGKLRFVVRDSTGADRIAETAAIATAANVWKHIAVSWNFNPMITANNNKVTVYVDGVQRAQQTFTSTTTSISSQLGTLYFGDNRSSYTGLNGTGRSADAVIDEIRIYNYELSQQGVASLMSLNSDCLDHYAITSSGSGSSCQVLPVTIDSHTSTHNVFINNNTIALSTSDGRGNWSLITGHGTLTPGSPNTGSATYRFSAESRVVLGLLHPLGTLNAHVSDGLSADSENTPITITSTGCAPADFNAYETTTAAGAITGVIRTKLAGTAFSLDLAAINASNALETGFNETVLVELVDPSGGGACAAWPAFHTLSPNPTFTTGTGRKTVTLTSALAKSNANVRVTCATPNCTPAVQACSTDSFAIRPHSFAVTANLGGPTLKAGNNFTMTANSGVSGSYTGTPSLDGSKVQDHNGNPAGTLTGSFGAGTGAAASGTFQYHDVGTISMLADAVTDNSFTSIDQPADCIAGSTSNTLSGGMYGCLIGSATTGPFGRFYPDHFSYTTTLTPAHNGFTYMSQPALGITLALEARSLNESVTSRYTAGYGTLGTFSITGDNGGTAVNVSARMNPVLPAFVWSNGRYAVGHATTAFLRTATVDGSYENFALKANILSEPDGVAISGASLSNATRIRFGRLRLANAYGSVSPLQIPVEAQYWTGKSWVKNTEDTGASGTALGGLPSSYDQTGWPAPVLPATLSAGPTNIPIIPSLAGTRVLTLNLATMPWLQSKWGGTTYNENPSAKATFGIFSAEHKKTIHIRELY